MIPNLSDGKRTDDAMDPYHEESDAEGEVDPDYVRSGTGTGGGGAVLDPSLGVSLPLASLLLVVVVGSEIVGSEIVGSERRGHGMVAVRRKRMVSAGSWTGSRHDLRNSIDRQNHKH